MMLIISKYLIEQSKWVKPAQVLFAGPVTMTVSYKLYSALHWSPLDITIQRALVISRTKGAFNHVPCSELVPSNNLINLF